MRGRELVGHPALRLRLSGVQREARPRVVFAAERGLNREMESSNPDSVCEGRSAHEVAIAQLVRASARTLVVVDDDPGGTQTLHGVQVLTEWSIDALATTLRSAPVCFCVLTNSRSLPASTAASIARELAANLAAAAQQTGRQYALLSRSDSTLRGHFWAEINGLREGDPNDYDAVVFAPAFFEADRVTIDDVHYVREGGRLIPVGETEFARDATFGYRESNLRDWIVAQSRGSMPRTQIVSLRAATLRTGTAATDVREQIRSLPRGTIVIVNAETYADLAACVHGLLLAEASGSRLLYRAAPSFIRLRAAISPRALLTAAELGLQSKRGGLVVVGSYTAKTTGQLMVALRRPRTVGVEVDVERLAHDHSRTAEVTRAAGEADMALKGGLTCIVYTSRNVSSAAGPAGDLAVARQVSSMLVDIVHGLQATPKFVVAKGGITASDIATKAFKARSAWTLGPIVTGVPVWQLGQESRFPGLPLIFFPGNFGNPDTLCEVLDRLE